MHRNSSQADRRVRHLGVEERLLVTGIVLLVVAPVTAVATGSPDGPARVLGSAGLAALALCAAWGNLRLYQASASGSPPRSVGKIDVRVSPPLVSTATTVAFALVLPAGLAIVLLALVPWAWLALTGVLFVGAVAMVAARADDGLGDRPYFRESREASVLLGRLCMRADVPVPDLVVEASPLANAWTSAGRIHLTTPLLDALDPPELEAVLAHEIAHLAHRDGALMEACSGPSRFLLGYAAGVVAGLRLWVRNIADFGSFGATVAFLAGMCVPAAVVLGWVSRLSVLGMSRAREFAADAGAAALTGRPSALASALMKLDAETDAIPRADLRQFEAQAVLCILGNDRSRLGRPFCTHPRTAARVKRLQALEELIGP